MSTPTGVLCSLLLRLWESQGRPLLGLHGAHRPYLGIPQNHCLVLDLHSSPHTRLVHGGLFEGAALCAPVLRLCLTRKWTDLSKKLLLPPEAQEQWPVGHPWVCIWSEPQNWTVHVHSPLPWVPFSQQGWSGLSLSSWQDQRMSERWRYLLALEIPRLEVPTLLVSCLAQGSRGCWQHMGWAQWSPRTTGLSSPQLQGSRKGESQQGSWAGGSNGPQGSEHVPCSTV